MKALVFDTETTDLIRNSALPLDKQPRVVEFFGLELEGEGADWKEVGSYQSYFNPTISMPPKAAEITGYTDDFLKDKPLFRMSAAKIRDMIESADILVAHNLRYDFSMLNFEFRRVEMDVNWRGRKLCTVESTMHLCGFRLNLTKLHEHLFGEAFTGAHGAEADVRATGRCFVELMKREEI